MATDTEERIMVVIGSTGSGKSSICNVLAGNQHDGNLFPASSSMKPCTNKTTAKKVYWRGDAKKPFTLVDTPGLNDPEPGRDSTNISEMADERKKLSHVNVFLYKYIFSLNSSFKSCWKNILASRQTIIII